MFITFGITLASMIVGAVVTWLVARHYYVQAARELAQEAADLRHLTTLVLRGIENAGLVELNRDSSGRITSLSLASDVTLSATPSFSTEAQVIPPVSSDHAGKGAESSGKPAK